MTPRSELIFDHELQIPAEGRYEFTVPGKIVQGFSANEGRIIWQGKIEWCTTDESIVLVEVARNNAGMPGGKRIRVGDRILVSWG